MDVGQGRRDIKEQPVRQISSRYGGGVVHSFGDANALCFVLS